MRTTMILTRERSEEEKARRHKYGDKGAKFSGGKVPRLVPPDVIGTITTMITKDLLLFGRHRCCRSCDHYLGSPSFTEWMEIN